MVAENEPFSYIFHSILMVFEPCAHECLAVLGLAHKSVWPCHKHHFDQNTMYSNENDRGTRVFWGTQFGHLFSFEINVKMKFRFT